MVVEQWIVACGVLEICLQAIQFSPYSVVTGNLR